MKNSSTRQPAAEDQEADRQPAGRVFVLVLYFVGVITIGGVVACVVAELLGVGP